VTPERGPESDRVVRELREEIVRADRRALAAVNERLRLVGELRTHKLARGWDFVDLSREERLVASLLAENPGPLSEEGVRSLFRAILELTKRELGEST